MIMIFCLYRECDQENSVQHYGHVLPVLDHLSVGKVERMFLHVLKMSEDNDQPADPPPHAESARQ
jgi:hypothetical protein